MALRLSPTSRRLLAPLLLASAAANAAPANDNVGAATLPENPANWADRVQIDSAPDTTSLWRGQTDLVLRIVTPEDSKSLNQTGLGKVFGDNRPKYYLRDKLPGSTIDSQPSPGITLMPAMANAMVASYFRHAPDALPSGGSTLRFLVGQWALVHQGNRRDNPVYRLNHRTSVEQRWADGTLDGVTTCSNSDRTATLDQWQANDYAMVKLASSEIALNCVGQLARKMPTFYPRPLATEDLSDYAGGVVPPARVRIFGASGRGITVYTEATCSTDYRGKIEVKRSNARAIGGLFGGAPKNIVIGIPETNTVRNMKSVLFSMPNYEEYEVAGGKPLIVDARIENSANYHCAGTLSAQFVPRPGQDYEVEMDVAESMCRLHIRQVKADGSLSPQQVRPAPQTCSKSADEQQSASGDETGSSGAPPQADLSATQVLP